MCGGFERPVTHPLSERTATFAGRYSRINRTYTDLVMQVIEAFSVNAETNLVMVSDLGRAISVVLRPICRRIQNSSKLFDNDHQREDSKLTAQATDSTTETKTFPGVTHEVICRGVDAQVEFVLDGSDKVASLILRREDRSCPQRTSGSTSAAFLRKGCSPTLLSSTRLR